jgi:hypothetical protein
MFERKYGKSRLLFIRTIDAAGKIIAAQIFLCTILFIVAKESATGFLANRLFRRAFGFAAAAAGLSASSRRGVGSEAPAGPLSRSRLGELTGC